MKYEEYRQLQDEITRKYSKELNDLAVKYAHFNNPYKIGDFVTDHIGTIKIEKIKAPYSRDNPQCFYYGLCYTKKGKPYKSGEKRDVYLSNVVRQDD